MALKVKTKAKTKTRKRKAGSSRPKIAQADEVVTERKTGNTNMNRTGARQVRSSGDMSRPASGRDTGSSRRQGTTKPHMSMREFNQQEFRKGGKRKYPDTAEGRYRKLRDDYDALLKKYQREEVAKGEKSRFWPIIKERQRGRGKGYNTGGTVKRKVGGEISTKQSTVKRKTGGSIGMGAALRGGGAVRKRGS